MDMHLRQIVGVLPSRAATFSIAERRLRFA